LRGERIPKLAASLQRSAEFVAQEIEMAFRITGIALAQAALAELKAVKYVAPA
jgi:hypothetical protein